MFTKESMQTLDSRSSPQILWAVNFWFQKHFRLLLTAHKCQS